ncbi:MAG: recombinase family protein [Gemmatales bacterium]
MKDRMMKPRNGHTFHVGIVARISGCQNQKDVSLEDQIDHGKEETRNYYDAGTPEYHIISTKGKGENLERPELETIEALIRSRVLDLLVVEDLGRLVRGTEASVLCGIAVDHGVRVIAINDCIDTAELTWEEDVISACRDHVGHNAHTSKRIKKKMMKRFQRNGQAMARPIFGYIVSAEAESYDDWVKNIAHTPVILELFQRLRENPNCSHAASWLNSTRVPTGPYHRNEEWDTRMVRRFVDNPLLKGYARRGDRHTVKKHEVGKRKSVKNPDGPVYYPCPHLAHVPPELWEEVNALLELTNKGRGRKPVDGSDPRAGIARGITLFPGQHLRCGICRRLCYWGKHLDVKHMVCSGVRDYACWNATHIDGLLAGQRILEAVFAKLEELPDFDEAFVAQVRDTEAALRVSRPTELAATEQALQTSERELENLYDQRAKTGDDDILGRKIAQVKNDHLQLKLRLSSLRAAGVQEQKFPTMAQLREHARCAIGQLSHESPDLGVLMKRLIPRMVVVPHQLCDGGKIVHRLRFTLNLVPFLVDLAVPNEVDGLLRHELSIDLFKPPQRVRFRKQILELRASGLTEAEAAKQVGITITAAQHAAKLDKLMKQRGLTDPYVPLTEPPGDDCKLKRHLHPDYRFRPLDDTQAA